MSIPVPLRPIQLPKDIECIVELIVHGFQYPENATWSLQTDQVENMVSVMRSARQRILLPPSSLPPIPDDMSGGTKKVGAPEDRIIPDALGH
jgi:hypothetical protein